MEINANNDAADNETDSATNVEVPTPTLQTPSLLSMFRMATSTRASRHAGAAVDGDAAGAGGVGTRGQVQLTGFDVRVDSQPGASAP